MIGKTLGHFRIEARAGAGGMGEVYLARDTRLDRVVAIKVLPAELASDPHRRERLKREAQAISRLNHPHVCTLYDIGQEEDIDFLVLEYLEGSPLSDRLTAGPLPLTEALKFAAQIAEGLDAAHRLGIVHRDLKPANVMLTATGAKLLDFGLAKEFGGGEAGGTMIATRTVGSGGQPITAEGTILGTLQYMAPEQLHGEPADARSDLFSFGAMLYEMVTGHAPFTGKSQASVIASILEKEPEPLAARGTVAPRSLDRLVKRCLEKEPDARWQNARDLMHELRWIAANPTEGEPTPGVAGVPASRMRRSTAAAIAAGVAVMCLAVGFLLGPRLVSSDRGRGTGAPEPMVRATIPLPEGQRIAGWGSPTVAISDDGSTIAFVTVGDDRKQHLYVRRLDALASVLVPDSESAEGPFFSPDGKWLVFAVATSGGARTDVPELRLHSLESGITQTLCRIRDYFGGDWHEDGTILWSDQIPTGLWRIRATGGESENLLPEFDLDGEKLRLGLGWPRFLPGGRHVLASALAGGEFSEGVVVDLQTGQLTTLGEESAGMQLIPGNRMAWVDFKGTLMVAPFDLEEQRLGAAGRAVERNISRGGNGGAVLAVAENGTALLTRGPLLGSGRSPRRLVRIGEDGIRMVPPIEPGLYRSFALSPIGDRVALAAMDGLRIHDLNRGGRTDLSLGPVRIAPLNVLWSPDGSTLVFCGAEANATSLDVYVVDADGASLPRKVFDAESESSPVAWEPDGRALLVSNFAMGGDARTSIHRVPVDGGASSEVDLGADARSVAISPQGDLIAYIQVQGNANSVFVRTYPELGPKVAVASGDCWSVLWAEDGSSVIAFSSKVVEAVEITRGTRPEASGRRVLMDGAADIHVPRINRGLLGGFYVLEDLPGAGIVTSLELVTNWVQHLP